MLKVLLLDLAHNYSVDNTSLTIPLSLGYVKAYALAQHGAENLDIKLFKHPDRLLAAIDGEAPDVIGFANYGWNANLNLTFGTYLRKKFPNALFVAGGPNIDHAEDRRLAFLKRHAYLDFVIVSYGEEAFSELLTWWKESRGDYDKLPGNLIWRDGDAVRATAEHELRKIIDNIPSPYLGGYLDEFLALDMIPLFETNRGCPFSCSFCAWGNARLGQVRRFDLENILAEIEYVAERSNANNWIVCDANFGLLPRDVDIARAIRAVKDRRGLPKSCYNWLAKNVTERNLQIAEIMGDMSVPVMAIQSLDKQVLINIKRDNIKTSTYVAYQQKFHSIGARTYSDLIVPLPGETLDSHLHALRSLMDYGVDMIQSHNMRLLAGAETNSTETRTQYQFKTKWRLIHGDAGIYRAPDGTELRSFEVEESLRSTSTMTEDEVFYLRKMHFLMHLCWTSEVYKTLFKTSRLYGVHGMDVFKRLIDFPGERLRRFWAEFDEYSHAEWFESEDAIRGYFAQDANFQRLINREFEKLNIMFSVVVLRDYKHDFDAAVAEILRDTGAIPEAVLGHALKLAVATFPTLDADLAETTIEMPHNFGELDQTSAHSFTPSSTTVPVRLLASPKRTMFRTMVLQSSGKTLSKILDTNGLDFADMRFVPQNFPLNASLAQAV